MDDLDPATGDVPVATPRSSHDKLGELLERMMTEDPGNEEMAQLQAMLRMAGPMVSRFVPANHRELDTWLLVGARMMLYLRSDDALPQVDVDQVLETAIAEALETAIAEAQAGSLTNE
jgi:hypothetical protein